MGMGAEGSASAGGADYSSLYASGGTGPGQPGVGSTLSVDGGGGLAASIKAFMDDPKNMQLLGQLLQQGSRFHETSNKLPPDAKRFFEAAMAKTYTMSSGGGPGGAPGLGSMQPSSGPYMGDAASYNIDPVIARSVLSRMGIA